MMKLPSGQRERFGMLFVGVARRWRAALDASLAELGLSDATWGPLIHIGRAGGISQKELAARVGIDTSTLVRLLDILAGKHLIERRQDPADRRANLLFITPAGEQMAEHIQGILIELEERMLVDVDDATMTQMLDTLEQLDRRIRTVRKGDVAA